VGEKLALNPGSEKGGAWSPTSTKIVFLPGEEVLASVATARSTFSSN